MVFHCDFNFHFPNDLLMLSIFSFACIHPYIFGEMSVQRFYPLLLFFKLGCCSYDFKIFLYYESERSMRVGAMSALIKIPDGKEKKDYRWGFKAQRSAQDSQQSINVP